MSIQNQSGSNGIAPVMYGGLLSQMRMLPGTAPALLHAHNIDITDINPGFNEHTFPRHWYYATVLGRYEARGKLGRANVLREVDGVAYGYQRSLEAGADNWQRSVTLRPAGQPVKMVAGR